MSVPARLLVVLATLLFLPPAALGAERDAVPELLQEWIPWALRGQETAACARLEQSPLCVWPGRLALDLDDRGGRFALDLVVDAPAVVALPGDPIRWPRDVRSGGGPRALNAGGVPAVSLPAGTHRVEGAFVWSRLPESLAVPPTIALVDLTVQGEAVAAPRRDADGLLWLQGGASEEAEEDRLAIEVHRRVDDGVPVRIATKLRLRVSGRSREVRLGSPTLAATTATALASSLPARLDGDGALQVQLRPGDWEITIQARSDGPVPSLVAPSAGAPWPDEEVWVFQAAPAIRSVRVDGAPGVDPSRTSLPDEWRSLPAWRVAAGGSLDFVELRRGEADPPPDRLNVHRKLWLSLDGTEFAVQDRLDGKISQGGRLELAAPGALGSAKVSGRDQLVTVGDGGGGGVEVRDGSLNLEGVSLWKRSATLPAVGWNRDARSLGADLHLPPGWRLITATGVDHAGRSWLERWTLMDLFLVLLIALAVGRLTSKPWGLLTLVILALSWQEPDAPTAGWITLLVLLGLLRVLPGGRFAGLVHWVRWAVVVGMAAHVVGFSWQASRAALFPQLDNHGQGAMSGSEYDPGVVMLQAEADEAFEQENAPMETKAVPQAAAPMPQKKVKRGRGGTLYGNYESSSKVGWGKRASRLDPQAVVQTGPGLPRWSWETHRLTWNGPVAADHTIRLTLLGPMANGALGLAQVAGAILLLLLLGDPRRTGTEPKDPEPDDEVPEPDDEAPEPELPEPEEEPEPVDDEDHTQVDEDDQQTISHGSLPKMGPLALLLALLIPAVPATSAAQAPSPELLNDLRSHLLTRPPCEPDCVQVADLVLAPRGDRLRITASVHAGALAPWRLPGPDSAWAPTRVLLDGREVVALHRDASGFLVMRVPEGVHEVVLEGPARDEIALQFSEPPRVLRWQGAGWTLAGHRADAAPPSAVQLSRSRPLDEGAPGSSAEENAELPPWLQVHRELDLGVPWLVHNQVVRLGGGNGAVLMRVPLLPGESVTTPGIVQEGDVAIVALEPGEASRGWDSTLAETERLELRAPPDRPWTEVWSLDCSPIFSCAAEGLAPTRHLAEGRWLPQWQPWPGETLAIALKRPTPAEGATTTVDSVVLKLTSGRRLLEASLTVSLRSSQGGEQTLTLPPGASLRTFRLNGKDHPAQTDGDRLVFATEPGATGVYVEFGLPAETGFLPKAPPVDVGRDVSNVQIEWTLPDHRWVLWTWGPRWGPVVTVWQYILLLFLVAFLLARFAPTPLTGVDWFLLGLGLTQVPPQASAVLVLWLVALSFRGRARPDEWWKHALAQMSLVGLTLGAFGVLYAGVYQGLVMRPDLGVSGAGSWGNTLSWFVDTSGGELPRPGVLWLPIWVWRVAMLLWALWLASRLLRWVKWGWEQARVGGLWSWPPLPNQGAQEGSAGQS